MRRGRGVMGTSGTGKCCWAATKRKAEGATVGRRIRTRRGEVVGGRRPAFDDRATRGGRSRGELGAQAPDRRRIGVPPGEGRADGVMGGAASVPCCGRVVDQSLAGR